MQSARPQYLLDYLKGSGEVCSFLSTNMQHTWDEFYFNKSLVGVIEKYVEKVEDMESTILVPSRLMGLEASELLPPTYTDSYIQELDMKAFYQYMKAVKTQIALGSSYIAEAYERNSPFQCKLRDSTKQINQVILIAKYITIFAQNIAFQSRTITYREFENNVRFTENSTLLGAIKNMLKAVEEMEKAVLFPCLLKDHGVVDDLPKFSNTSSQTVDNLHDIFTMLKLLKNEILSGPQYSQLPEDKIHLMLAELYETLVMYTSLTCKLTKRYKQEVQCV